MEKENDKRRKGKEKVKWYRNKWKREIEKREKGKGKKTRRVYAREKTEKGK